MGQKARKRVHLVDASSASDALHAVLESCNYSGKESIILEGPDGFVESWNSGGDGSNPLVLPGKKVNKSKEKSKASERSKKKVAPPLSKNKQRKLKQLEEEKRKKLLQSKSIEALEKYKISDDAYSILYSSGTIGHAETFKEKRLRAVQFSKAGLEVPEDIFPLKKKNKYSFSNKNVLVSDLDADQSLSLDSRGDIFMLPAEHKEQVDSYGCSIGSNLNITTKCEDATNADNVVSPSEETIDKGMNTCMTTEENNSSIFRSFDQKDEVPCRPDENDQQMNSPNFVVQGNAKPTVVYVSRPVEVEEQRKELPIVMMEQEIMEAINEHSKIILCGETGCGKTTQVPQFLYEAGFGSSSHNNRKGRIGVTQPRRVAVLATAKRVSFELGLQLGKEVGFQVRHDKFIGKKCSIKFMTDGILLREVQSDFLLKRYSVIILDEAHERSLNTDILIGMLSRIIKLREEMYREQKKKISAGIIISPENMITQLKVVLMSATLRVEDFISNKKLFEQSPPVIEVPVRQYPVTIHFSKRTHDDYLGQAYKKVMTIHKRLPPGGILVFVTGQREVDFLCKKLRKLSRELTKIYSTNQADNELTEKSELNMKDIDEAFRIENDMHDQQTDRFSNFEDDFDNSVISSDLSDTETDSDLDYQSEEEDQVTTEGPKDTGLVSNLLGDAENLSSLKASFDALARPLSDPVKNKEPNNLISSNFEKETEHAPPAASSMYVLPLYAMLPASAQLRVFEEVPEGERLVVVATNVAETSITIPGITYVVDTGKEKVKNYNHKTGIATYEVNWISKASAAQRAGRAGRTGPGHCYRLYSSAAFSKNEIFPEFSCPEISKVPVDGVVLLMKFLNIHKVVNFPFPTPPKSEALVEAEHCLKSLEALDSQGGLTSLGRSMAQYPMSPRHSRMLLTIIKIMRNQKGYTRANIVLGYAIAAAAALSFQNPFLLQFGDNNETAVNVGQEEQFASNEIKDQPEKQGEKKAKSKVKEARARFCNPSSDALTAAYALQLFEHSSNTGTFCRENSLHLKTMEDMSKLRKQLLHLIFYHSKFCEEYSWNHGTSEDVEFSWRIHSDKNPLLMNEEELIGQSICAGWVDRVAKRVRRIKHASENDTKARSVSYQSCASEDAVFVHRWSSVSRSTPEFVVYTELLHTKRPYMHGVTNVKPEWLVKYASSLCTFSAPLTDPKPFYEPLKDQIFCWVTPSFGRHNWQLPLHSLPIKNDISRLSVFASALLEGHVLPCLRSVQKLLVMPPSIILRPEALGQRRVGDLLSRLKFGMKTIDSRSMLRDIWNENPLFLYSEIQQWFQEKFHNQLEKIWDQMHYEAHLEGHELYPKRAKQEGKVKRR